MQDIKFTDESQSSSKSRKYSFYPVHPPPGFDGIKYLEDHPVEFSYEYDEVNGVPMLIIYSKIS